MRCGTFLWPRCQACGERAEFRCAAIIGKNDRGVAILPVRCDAPICRVHRIPDPKTGKDYCSLHSAAAAAASR